MIIQELSHSKCIDLLNRAKIGRLGCTKDLQPYVVPISIVYADRYIYSFSTVGMKIEWMRLNPRVCVEVEEMTNHQEWETAIVFGTYQELSDYPEQRQVAHTLLSRSPLWWEPGYVKTVRDGEVRPLDPIYFRISVETISGHQGLPT